MTIKIQEHRDDPQIEFALSTQCTFLKEQLHTSMYSGAFKRRQRCSHSMLSILHTSGSCSSFVCLSKSAPMNDAGEI